MLKKIMHMKIMLPLLFLLTTQSPAWAEDGKPVDLSDYQGKVVLVDFWASWCAPCRQSFPWLNEMHRTKSSQGLVVIGVNVDENAEDAKRFLDKNPALFKLIYDPKGQHASYYKLPGMPTTLIFDRQGKLQHRHSGFKTNKIKEYTQAVDQMLAK